MYRFIFSLCLMGIMMSADIVSAAGAAEAASGASPKRLMLETSKGVVEIEMMPDLAPRHVARIAELVREGFYDGVIFHRVIPGFMAQTGDPTGTGRGGSGVKLEAEFSDYSFVEGSVGMARSMDPDSADSQFFICFEGCGHLSGQYTIWGQVITGMEIMYEINKGQPPRKPDTIIQAEILE